MTFLDILLVVAQVGTAASPAPAPPLAAVATTPLKEIAHTRSSPVCTTLVHNLFPAVKGLLANDDLANQSQNVMARIAQDSAASVADPRQEAFIYTVSATLTGSAEPGPVMDNYRLSGVMHAIAQNLDQIENLLADPHAFRSDPANASESQLLLAKARMEEVAAHQRALLNVLSATAATNDANDLRSRRDTIPYEHDMSGPQTPKFTFITMPQALARERDVTQQSEAGVALALLPLVASCQ